MASRKNHTLKLAGILLALVLVTSCFVGGTFAKYVTSGTGKDTARVAKFGVTVTANGTMFAKEYDTDTGNVKGTIARSVLSTDKVIAPGTKGSMVSMTIKGTPEVAVNVRYKATVKLDNWVYKADESETGEFYCPIKIKVGDEIYFGYDYPSAERFKNAVETAINGYSDNYAPGTDLTKAKAPVVSWAWAFEDNAVSAKQTDVKDTYLGDQAAKDKAATIDLEVVTTVTQID